MKKLIIIFLLLITGDVFAQNTVTVESGTNSFIPQFRYKAITPDSLNHWWMINPTTGKANRIFTATEANLLFTGGGGSAVSTVFGRSGVVVAATNDYTFAQIGSKPTTLSGYGITNAYPLTGNPSNFLVSPLVSNGDLITQISGVPGRIAIGGANTVLHGGSSLSYSNIVNGDIANSTIDLTAKVTGLLPNGNTTATTAVTASTIAERDGNSEIFGNNFIGNLSQLPVSGSGTLVASSAQYEYITGTGSGVYTVTLPVVSTLTIGKTYTISTNPTVVTTVTSSGGEYDCYSTLKYYLYLSMHCHNRHYGCILEYHKQDK